ncbi:hypothetical protein HMPREF1484_00212 [Dermabacter sp. HFH0086]|nr:MULTISPECIES: hypothetical protein [Dermabacter]EPH17527.1 hypothetical protein HMPREF1484_00212 [Dermabacter sp. HFH0086]
MTLFTVICAAIAVAGAVFSILTLVDLLRDERASRKPTDYPHLSKEQMK